ncbi:ankyrin repeat domain-containing protein 34B-like [Arapaima gigas]
MAEPQEYLADGSPLITAAQLGKLRLVRLLVEGGAQVNERNQRGETPLLVACKALGGQQGSSPSLRLIQYLLENQADPNSQDKAGRTPLMYACMARAGPEVAAALITGGADPSLEDYAGVSSLVYAIKARDHDTVQVLLDTCRQNGRDIIVIATELTAGGGSITRRYLNVLPSPDSSPVSCTSPSEIELKTSSPGSDTGSFFDFRSTDKGEHQRLRSEPFLAIQDLEHLRSSYTETLRWQEDKDTTKRRFLSPGPAVHTAGRRWSIHSLGAAEGAEVRARQARPPPQPPPERAATSGKPLLLPRRNTLPTLQDQSIKQLPSLWAPQLQDPLMSQTLLSGEAPEGTSLKPDPGIRWRVRSPGRAGFLPPIPVSPTPPLQTAPRSGGHRSRRLRSHSMQLEEGGPEEVPVSN